MICTICGENKYCCSCSWQAARKKGKWRSKEYVKYRLNVICALSLFSTISFPSVLTFELIMFCLSHSTTITACCFCIYDWCDMKWIIILCSFVTFYITICKFVIFRIETTHAPILWRVVTKYIDVIFYFVSRYSYSVRFWSSYLDISQQNILM